MGRHYIGYRTIKLLGQFQSLYPVFYPPPGVANTDNWACDLCNGTNYIYIYIYFQLLKFFPSCSLTLLNGTMYLLNDLFSSNLISGSWIAEEIQRLTTKSVVRGSNPHLTHPNNPRIPLGDGARIKILINVIDNATSSIVHKVYLFALRDRW